jgi:hypothetical protein
MRAVFAAALFLIVALSVSSAPKEKSKPLPPSLPAPTFSVPGGVYTNAPVVTLLSPAGTSTVRYTLDGTEPTEESPAFAGPLTLTNSTILRARAFDPGKGVSAVASASYTWLGPDVVDFNSNLPLVIINTLGQVLEPDQKRPASLRVIGQRNGHATLLGTAEYDGRAILNIRGRASLRYPKRSYTAKLLGAEEDVATASILEMPTESDWVLYAPYPDKTLMRDVLAYELHHKMGHWAPRTRFVEVFVNEEGGRLSKANYAGVYVLAERIKRDKNRVDLKKLDPDDNTQPKLSGGYLFKKDHIDHGWFGQPDLTGGGAMPSSSSNRFGFPTAPGGFPGDPAGFQPAYMGRTSSSSSSSSSSSRSSSGRRNRLLAVTNHVGVPQRNEIENSRTYISTENDELIVQKQEQSFLTTLTTNRFYYVEPESDEITPVQKAWLREHLNQVESAIYGPDFRDASKGYRAFIDVDSFIDHHLIVETTKNVDGFRFSTFYSLDRGGKIKMEPIWDWNLSFGNANGKQGWIPEYWLWPQLDEREYTWFRRLFEDPDFAQRYVDRWSQLRTNVLATANVLTRVDELATLLNESQARNFERWPILGLAVNPNMFVGESYAAEIQWMKEWIATRLAWMEKQFVPAPAVAVDTGKVTLSAPTGKIHYTLDGTDPRAPGGAPSKAAKVYESALPLPDGARLFARTLRGNRWSAPALR